MAPRQSSNAAGKRPSTSTSSSNYSLGVTDGSGTSQLSYDDVNRILQFTLGPLPRHSPTTNPFPTRPLPLDEIVLVRNRPRAIAYIMETSIEQIVPVVFEVLFMEGERGVNMFNLIGDQKGWHSLVDRYPDLAAVFSPKPRPEGTELTIIVNPKAGGAGGGGIKAMEFLKRFVEPILRVAGIKYTIIQTKGVEDAGRIGREVLAKQGGIGRNTIAILGGDGSVHDLINGIMITSSSKPIEIDLVIIPFGTANALYYSLFPPESPLYSKTKPIALLYSLLAYVRGHELKASPLSLCINTLPSQPHQIFTSVVTSACMHANILLDSEALRRSIPGVERFKVAAIANAARWWQGKLSMTPEVGKASVQVYDVTSLDFRPLEVSPANGSAAKRGVGYHLDEETGASFLTGPFVFVVASLVSRFEDKFLPTPFRGSKKKNAKGKSLAPDESSATIDVVVIRPLRDIATCAMYEAYLLSSVSSDMSVEGRERDKKEREKLASNFAGTVWDVMKGMYNQGEHVNLKYLSLSGEPTSVVEYFRCGGLTWEPDPSDDIKSNIVCLDGALRDLGNGGKLETRPISAESSGVRVWC